MKPPSGPKKQTQFKPNLVRRRRIANELKIRPHPAPLPSIILFYKCEELGKNTEGLHTDNYAKNKVNSIVFAL